MGIDKIEIKEIPPRSPSKVDSQLSQNEDLEIVTPVALPGLKSPIESPPVAPKKTTVHAKEVARQQVQSKTAVGFAAGAGSPDPSAATSRE